MDYEVEPSRLTRRSSASGFAVAALIVIALAGIVVVTNGAGSGAGEVRPVADAAPSSVPAALVLPSPSPSPRPAFLPSPYPSGLANTPLELTCHAIGIDQCRIVADAAVAAARDPYLPSAATVDVWASLVCGSTLDCPPNQLADLLPLGSATISYRGSEIVLWVNVGEVVDRSSPAAASSSPIGSDLPPVASIPTIDAWVLRPHP
jgi:hypothetical protein